MSQPRRRDEPGEPGQRALPSSCRHQQAGAAAPGEDVFATSVVDVGGRPPRRGTVGRADILVLDAAPVENFAVARLAEMLDHGAEPAPRR
ncbi:hypothetical protein [Phycicoccus flavus]|uniref:hypothetical protein n=1 Tax=Phycicoccus flavus TaxID=2502783 RepID=UPI000FEB66B4|nr:hypothetical protein [Phycicoccus flavus]NHA66607.1 hypothetical protein [Phycicoccus flavus]